MTEGTSGTGEGTPKHLWIVGILAVLWNLGGAYDYLMTQTQNESYMASFTPEQLEFFYGFPSWLVVFWAVAVWGSVLGSILLLMRKRVAMPVFLMSLVAMSVTAFHNFALSNGAEIMGTTGMVFSGVIFLVAVGLLMYSKAMVRRGVLT